MNYFVTATYQVETKNHKEFVQVLEEAEKVMRSEGLITDRPAYRMTSQENPELILEIFEWINDESFNKAQENPKVLQLWGKLETLWKNGGFGLKDFPESSKPWAQYKSL